MKLRPSASSVGTAFVIAGYVVCWCLLLDTGHAADPPAAAKPARRSFNTLQEADEFQAAQRAAHLKTFREAFEHGQTLSVRARLDRAATVTGELAALAEKIADPKVAERMRGGYTTRAAIYPRVSHLVRLLGERPWLRDESPSIHRLTRLWIDSEEFRWPMEKDQPELRRLVNDNDPDIQAMAIEALATLHDPSDLKLIARVQKGHMFRFGSPAPTVPSLTEQYPIWANGWPGDFGGDFGSEDDPLLLGVYWGHGSITDYADRALRHMTGDNVTTATFEAWLAKHGDTRDSLWYWQQRMQREYDRLEWSVYRLNPDNHDADHLLRLIAAKDAELRKSLCAELATMDRQVEAKVLLLTTNRRAGTDDLDEPQRRFFDPPWQTRLTRDELFKLLEGERPWNDVDWVDKHGHSWETDSRIATRIMLNAPGTFTRDDVPRLQGLLDNPKRQLSWSGRAAWLIGISRLLPVAAADKLDDSETRDGYLRKSIKDEQDVNVRGHVAREVVRIGLPANAPFLRDVFFAEQDASSSSDVRNSILQALGRSPLTDEMRKFLLELIADQRCRPLLTRPSRRAGDDLPRLFAVRSINAHAGRELVNLMDRQDLGDQKKSNSALDRIIDSLKKFDADRAKPGVIAP